MASNALTNLRGKDPGANRQTDAISRLVEPVAKAVMATPIMGAKPPAWIRPPLESGFVDRGFGRTPVRYHRDALAYVHVQGWVVHAAGVPLGTPLTTLPSGFRPGLDFDVAADSTSGFASLIMSSTGKLSLIRALIAGDELAFNFSFLAER